MPKNTKPSKHTHRARTIERARARDQKYQESFVQPELEINQALKFDLKLDLNIPAKDQALLATFSRIESCENSFRLALTYAANSLEDKLVSRLVLNSFDLFLLDKKNDELRSSEELLDFDASCIKFS